MTHAFLDHLQATDVSLTVFPSDEVWDPRREPFDRGCAGMEPVATVNQQAERRGVAERAVILEDAVLLGARIVRREGQNPRRARARGFFRQLGTECDVESRSGNDWQLSVSFLDHYPDHVEMFARCERYSFASPSGGDDRGKGCSSIARTFRRSASRSTEKSGRNGVIGKPMTPVSASRNRAGEMAICDANHPRLTVGVQGICLC